MYRTTIYTAFLCILVCVYSCNKSKTNAVAQSISISILSPEDGHIYHKGDSVKISAIVSYNGIMHGYEVKVTDTATGEVVYDYAEDLHKDSFHINGSFVASGTQACVYRLLLTAEVDHNGNDTNQQVFCKYIP